MTIWRPCEDGVRSSLMTKDWSHHGAHIGPKVTAMAVAAGMATAIVMTIAKAMAMSMVMAGA